MSKIKTQALQDRILAMLLDTPGLSNAEIVRRTGLASEIVKGAIISLTKAHAIYGAYTKHQLRVYYPSQGQQASALANYLNRHLPRLNPRGAVAHRLMDQGKCRKSPEPPARSAWGVQSSLGGNLPGSGL